MLRCMRCTTSVRMATFFSIPPSCLGRQQQEVVALGGVGVCVCVCVCVRIEYVRWACGRF
jgi:hypothetical protein